MIDRETYEKIKRDLKAEREEAGKKLDEARKGNNKLAYSNAVKEYTETQERLRNFIHDQRS